MGRQHRGRPHCDWTHPATQWGQRPPIHPALEALTQITRVRVLLEEGDESSDDNSVMGAVKMEVDSPPKTSSRGNADAPIDLTTSDEDSDKENDCIHPGPTWMHYDPRNPEHYRLDIPEHDHMTSSARYIQY